MPSWSIHLAVAKKVNEKLKLNKDLFYYGNLIPDVDKGTWLGRYEAHYYNSNLPFPTCPKEHMIDINLFLEDYKDKLSNPLILGYYSHLLTDNFYNNEIYTNKWVQDDKNNIIGIQLKDGKILNIDVEDKKRQKRKYKHKDFELYGKYLFKNKQIELPKDVLIIKNNIRYLKNKFLTDELVDCRMNYLNNNFKKFNKLKFKELIIQHNYKLFSKKELDKIFDDCVDIVLQRIMEVYDNNEKRGFY